MEGSRIKQPVIWNSLSVGNVPTIWCLKKQPCFWNRAQVWPIYESRELCSSHFCIISRQLPLIKALLVFQWDHFMNLCGKESSAKWQGTSDDPFLQLVLIINPHERSRNDCRSTLAWHSAQLSSLWYQTSSCNVWFSGFWTDMLRCATASPRVRFNKEWWPRLKYIQSRFQEQNETVQFLVFMKFRRARGYWPTFIRELVFVDSVSTNSQNPALCT